VVRVLPEDGTVSAETRMRFLVNVQIFNCVCAFSLKIKDIIAMHQSVVKFVPRLQCQEQPEYRARTFKGGLKENQNTFQRYKGRLISDAHSEISRKRDHVFKQTEVGSKVQYFSYKLIYIFFDMVVLSFNTFFPM
jgi:hypothetical protein